jgi:carboxypeptidase C (cathepsin A)
MRYTVTVEGVELPDSQGKAASRVVSIAYVAEKAAANRPVMFVSNGGPIASSQFLHIGVMGPKRLAVPDDLRADPATFALVDNSYSPLDSTDLVFVDPPGTGFSRVLPGVPPRAFYTVAADAQQFTAFISQWLKAHNRLGSPVYLLGESYATVRFAEVAAQLAELREPILTSGVVMMGQAVNIAEYSQRPQNIISYVVSLPTLAAIAWYHGKVKNSKAPLEQVVTEAWAYAQSDYLGALFQGNELSDATRDRVAARLEELTGIPAAYYREHSLRITKERFRGELLKDRGILIGRRDARYVGPMTDKGLAADPFEAVAPAFERTFAQYLSKDLGVKWPEHYIGIAEVKSFEEWGWGGTTPFSDWPYTQRLSKAMSANPQMRIFLGNGFYDTQTTVGAATLAARQAGWPKDRVSQYFYEGGHLPYTVESAARRIAADVRSFVREP